MYRGMVHTIDFGMSGLRTDDPETQMNDTDLKRATNVSYEGNKLSKCPGSHRFNMTALSAGIVSAFDWWPNDVTQRQITVTRDGLVWRMVDPYNQAVVLSSGSGPTNLQVTNQTLLVSGGAESATFNRKLFVLTGNNPIQVISGDAIVRYTISKPSADWSGVNQPFGGIIHRSRLWCWGNRNNKHGLYGSNPADHEDFQTFGGAAINMQVGPGEFEGILTCSVFNGQMMIFKYPRGVYYLNDQSPDYTQWSIQKYSDSFGAASMHSSTFVLNDMLIANAYGSITSYNAAQYYGGSSTAFDMADVLLNTRNSKFVRENMSPKGNLDRHGVYYDYKKQAFFSYRTSSGVLNNSILCIDYGGPDQKPKISWFDKDQPNCLYMKKDDNLIPRPCYGSEDGFIYLMDQRDRDVGGNAYQAEFLTPHIDFKNPQVPTLTEMNKIFDFLEFTIEENGEWSLNVDVFIDGKFSETIVFSQSNSRGTNKEMTNVDRTYDGAPRQVRRKMNGFGKRVALRGYNNGKNQNFTVLRAQIYFRPGTQSEKETA